MRLSYIIELEESHLNHVIEHYVDNMKNNNIPIVDDPRKRLQKYQINVMKEQRGYPLDYIINIPTELQQKIYDPHGITMDMLARVNRLKNAVMRRIVEIRQMKAKPKLSTLLQDLKEPRLRDPNVSEEDKTKIRNALRRNLRKKIMELYDDTAETMGEAEEIQADLTTVVRKSDAQWEILTSIE